MKLLAAIGILAFLAAAVPAAGRQEAATRSGVSATAARLASARARLATREAETARQSKTYDALARARDEAGRRLDTLLAALWPIRACALTAGMPAGGDWAETDRRYVWTRTLFEAVSEARAVYRDASVRAQTGLAARDAAQDRLAAGRRDADAAFSETVAERVRDLEARAVSANRDGPDILNQALEDTDGGPSGDTAPADAFRPPAGGLSWPARGRVAAGFAPSGRAARQGIVLAVPEGAPVGAAADGRVVFTGALRGLGRVVILSHEARCHTVYACLGQTDVSVGDAVARDAPLGQSGFCGPTKAPGVYFELRFREKALNPAEWLAARR